MNQNVEQAKHKHFRLTEGKIKLAQKILGTATETETIEQALDAVIAEHERTQAAWTAHRRFLKSAIEGEVEIRDVFGVMEE